MRALSGQSEFCECGRLVSIHRPRVRVEETSPHRGDQEERREEEGEKGVVVKGGYRRGNLRRMYSHV